MPEVKFIAETDTSRYITICLVGGREYTYKGVPDFVLEKMTSGEMFTIVLTGTPSSTVAINPMWITSVIF